MTERLNYTTRWIVRKFSDDEAYARGEAFEEGVVEGNLLLNEGITALLNLLAGNAETHFGNANARIGVGDATTAEAAAQTALEAVAARTAWQASTAYSLGQERRPSSITDASHLIAEVTTAGTSDASEPTWPTTDGGTVVDGTVTWTMRKRKWFKAMESGYPSISAQTITFRSVFGSGDANHDWNEFTAVSAADDTGDNLNRKVSDQGTKASGQTWTLDLQITFS